ncbi:sigma-70 family RNA polymerase sigma factor [Nocardiopsis ansamitocini]|uniref:RNA polymerase sigma factor n=1 Tax=Nocardiopsis ansamitocini TaxID=1670832 RepID=A0A9W6UGQ5_9ACTN|nr:sigma-70 family RNA polymerase sigma factor [Nocardiopsis ansamitocini]GLU45664.1 RNA polymerase sigma factor [Nocardiopsis ansamitocini]
MDDAELTDLAMAARDGAEDALERLVAETRADVTRFIARMADPLWVEELTQETFIRVLRGLPRFAGRSSARSWLLAIARYTVVDRYRSAAARPRTWGVEEWDGLQHRLPGYAARFDEQFALADLLSGLGEQRRRAFVLTQLEGFSYAEAARMAGVPVGTVRSRVARAREDLIRALRAADAQGSVAAVR